MVTLVRCPNPGCGHLSRVSSDPPGRVFRCHKCRSKLRAATAPLLREAGIQTELIRRLFLARATRQPGSDAARREPARFS